MTKHKKFAKSTVAPKKKEKPINLDIPDTNIYYQGWVKYYHYTNDTHYSKPPSLFQNNQFFAQRIPKDKLAQKDKFGYNNIPNKASFFLVLYNTSISLFSSRQGQTRKLIDSLKMSYIRVIPEDDVLKGGVRDDGNFPFGYCIEIVADIPNSYSDQPQTGQGSPETWILCTSKGNEKDLLLSTLIKLKVKHQRLANNGIKIMTEDKDKVNEPPAALGAMIANPISKGPPERSGMGSLKDGYWVLLQDWTSCSQKCGNGTSYQQWMCVPPKHGGKKCQGKAIRKKLCNGHPCPSVNNLLSVINKKETNADGSPALPVAPKPIVKVGLFSNRPQRYSRCIVKENDAFIVAKVDNAPEPIRKPIRILMNNRTVTVYNDDSYQEMYYTWNLEHSTFKYAKDQCCFEIQDNSRNAIICGYDQYCGPKDKNIWVDDWNQDFQLFKTTCKTDLPVNHDPTTLILDDALQNEIDKKSTEIMEEAQNNAASEQAMLVKKQVLKQSKRQYEKKKKNNEDLTFTAIGKEIQLEDMVKKEEASKEEMETQTIQAQIEKEEYKSDCLEQSFAEKELDDEFKESEQQSMDDIDEVQQQAKKKILNSRNKLKRSIQQMKLKQTNKRQGLSSKLKSIRTKMSKEIMLANKNGNIEVCRKGKAKSQSDYRDSYCNDNFVQDWTRNSDCKGEDFCYICCESEFGAMFVTQRDACYKMCDWKPKKKEKKPVELTGRAIRLDMKEQPTTQQTDDGTGKWEWAPKEKSAGGV